MCCLHGSFMFTVVCSPKLFGALASGKARIRRGDHLSWLGIDMRVNLGGLGIAKDQT